MQPQPPHIGPSRLPEPPHVTPGQPVLATFADGSQEIVIPLNNTLIGRGNQHGLLRVIDAQPLEN